MILFADTEDNSKELLSSGRSGFEKKVSQIAAIDENGERFYFGGDIPKFKTFLLDNEYDRVYFHNTQYDLGSLFADTMDDLDVTMVGGRLIKAQWQGISFLDTFNLFPMSAKKLGSAFKLEKLDMDLTSTDYVYRDIEIIREAILYAKDFFSQYNAPMRNTLSGGSIGIFKARGGTNWHDCSADSRGAAYGGRVELFKQFSITERGIRNVLKELQKPKLDGTPEQHRHMLEDLESWELSKKYWSETLRCRPESVTKERIMDHFHLTNLPKDIFYTDINSLYPFCLTKQFPDVISEQKSIHDSHDGIANVTVTVPELAVCPLPYRREDGAILYPFGTWRGTYTLVELRNAEVMGCKIKKVHWVKSTKGKKYYYEHFIKELYSRRLSADSDAMKLMLKLLMNSFYGGLLLSGEITRTCRLTAKTLKQWKSDAEFRRKNPMYGDSKILRTYSIPLPEHVNYCHAAHVLSYARIELLKYLTSVKPEQLIYCDTDSVFFESPDGKIPFEISTKLGGMKVEKKMNLCITYAPKCYRADEEFKAKGVRKDKAKKFLIDKEARVEAPFKMREAIRYFNAGNTHKCGIWRHVDKKVKTEYTKKSFDNNRFYPVEV